MDLEKILPIDGPSPSEVKKYLNKYTKEFVVIKCGGSILGDPDLFKILIENILVLKKLNFNPLIIHGGGNRINNKLNENNIKSQFINGLRVTDEKTIKIVEKVLITFNNQIVKAFIDQKCSAEGISSKHKNIILVEKENKNLGYVGIPKNIEVSILKKIIIENKVPIIAPLGLDNNKQVYNINADTAASAIAKTLKARRLLMVSDVEGVLDKNNQLITEINSNTAKSLIEDKVISGGMIPKVKNCIDVAKNGVKGVVIINGRKPHSILFELLSDKGSGTLIRK